MLSVGFGADADEDTLKQVACDIGMYYNATNASKISEIYAEIGDQIKVIANCAKKHNNITIKTF